MNLRKYKGIIRGNWGGSVAIGLALCITLWFLAAVVMSFPDPQGTDFYPTYVCAQEVLHGRSPYRPEVAAFLARSWDVVSKHHVQAAPVCAYPLPFYLVLAPLVALPFQWSLALWFSSLLLYPLLFLVLSADRRFALLPLAYYPLFHAATLKTSTVPWGAMTLLFLLVGERGGVLRGGLWSILPAKPQLSLLFAISQTREILKVRTVARAGLVVAVAYWVMPLLIIPEWPLEWVRELGRYRRTAAVEAFMPMEMLLPVVVLGTTLFARRSLIAAVAYLQLMLFPVNDLYCAIPLLFVWATFPWKIAVAGASISWVVPLVYDYPNSLEPMWIFLLLPLLVAGVVGEVQRYHPRFAPQIDP